MASQNVGPLPAAALRRVVIGASLALAFEAALYSAVAPLLPHYVDEFGLSKVGAGILTASYTLGVLVGSVASGSLADKIGPRRTVFAGLMALGVTTIAFGVAGNIYLLDGARLLQGVASGMIWAGVLTWLITSVPEERRGQAIGSAVGGALVGTLLGPLIGTVAVAVGDVPTFGVAGLISIGLGFWMLRLPRPVGLGPMVQVRILSAFSDRSFALVFVLSLIPGLLTGMVNVIIPLRLHDAGAASAVVGGMFVAMGLLMAVISPLAGRRADVVGERPPMLVGLGIAGTALFVLVFMHDKWSIAIMTVALGGCGLALCSVPGVSLLTRVAETAGLTAGATAAITNIAFAGGETLGAALSATAAEATSDAATMLGLAAICFVALLIIAFSKLIPSRPKTQLAIETPT